MGPQKTPVALLVGRAQSVTDDNRPDILDARTDTKNSFYEGHTMDLVTFATRVCKLLGVETMIVTNAAGGLNEKYAIGDIVCLNDVCTFLVARPRLALTNYSTSISLVWSVSTHCAVLTLKSWAFASRHCPMPMILT
jgi:hypothetical protein